MCRTQRGPIEAGIVALAGRRLDSPDNGTSRFPPQNVELVRGRIRRTLKGREVLVCSAACGADLIALEEASVLRMRRRVVLPFAREEFKTTSVSDRPGDWVALFDRIVSEIEGNRDLVVITPESGAAGAYAAVNSAILDEACCLSGQTSGKVVAVVVWEGDSRGEFDLTAAFRKEALSRGYPVEEINTF